MTVPSNLVPTSILQLPEDPSPSDLCWLMVVNNGATYKVQANAIVNVSGVPSTRQVNAGTGLTGGGDLSVNRTISVAVGGIGSTQLDNTGVTPGVYGSSSELPILTVDANGRVTAATTTSFSVSGYVPVTRQVIAGTGLSGGGALNANVTLNAVFSSSLPLALGAAAAGVANVSAREDHVHPAVNLASTVQTTGVLGMVSGGTGVAHTAPAAGSIAYSDGSGIQLSTVGLSGQVFVSGGASAPTWGSALIVSDQAANVFYGGPTSGPAAPTSFRLLVNADLPASGVSANTYGSATTSAVVAVDAKGVITTASNATITPAVGSITGLGTGVATWLATPSSANLAAAVTDETGSGALVFGTAPSLSAPTIDGANPYIQFSDGAAVTLAAGKQWYNGSTGSWNLGMGNGNITQQVGEEFFVYGKATASVDDSVLQIVYQTGTVGASGVITFAPTTSGITDSSKIIGIATEAIALNGFGRITSVGIVRGITTNGTAYGEVWADNDVIWYNPVTGNPTNVKPVAPNIKVSLGTIINAGSGGSGSIQVDINGGSVLGGTDSNVQFASETDLQLIQYYGAGQYWRNVNPSAISAGSVANALTIGTGLTGTSYNGSAAITVSITNTTVTAAAYGSASKTLTATVNAQGQLTALADTNIAISNTQVSGLGSAALLTAGAALGVATLDGGGTVPTSQLPAAVLGALKYQGTWNASTNTPTLASGVGTQGYYYVVSVAGSTNLDGITDWKVGDWAIFGTATWQKIDNTDAVTSVNGYTGTVVLTNTDISGFGTMSTQNAGSVAITGGTINGAIIGGVSAAAGTFTTCTATTFSGIDGGTF